MTRLEKFKQMVLSQDAHIKITLGAIIGIVGVIIGAMIYLTDIKQDVNSNRQTIVVLYADVEDNKSEIKDMNKEIGLVKIDQAKIFTELSSIKTMQIRMLDILERKD